MNSISIFFQRKERRRITPLSKGYHEDYCQTYKAISVVPARTTMMMARMTMGVVVVGSDGDGAWTVSCAHRFKA